MNERLLLSTLTLSFGLTLAIAFVIDDPFVWVGWGVAMVLVSGSALIQLNR